METNNSLLLKTNRPHRMLFLLAGFCVSLVITRAVLTQSVFFIFLVWNLILAYAPLAVSDTLYRRPHVHAKKIVFYPAFLCWLLLLPNAPYIITDFIHLKKELDVPVWFDVLLLISFAASGLLFGLESMKQMFLIISRKHTEKIAWVVMGTVCLLSAYGIYLGRYLRYNSWDIFHKPALLLHDVVSSLTDPSLYKASVGITLGFGTLLFLFFSLYHQPEQQD